MVEEGMNKEEKAIFMGILEVLNIDLCAQFECPENGCDTCPFASVVEAHQNFLKAACQVLERTEGAEI